MKPTTAIPSGLRPVQVGKTATRAATLAFLTLLALPAGAATITVNNHSFETNVLADGNFSTATPTGWTKPTFSGAAVGWWNPQDANYPGSTGGPLPSPADGNQTMFVNVGTNGGFGYLKQTTGAIIEAGKIYTMTVAVGARLNGEFDADNILLRLGHGTTTFLTPIADNQFGGTGNLTAGEFRDFSVGFTAQEGAAYLGQNLAVLMGIGNFAGNSAAVEFDNVRLTVIPIPEPSAALLLGATGCLLLLRRRR